MNQALIVSGENRVRETRMADLFIIIRSIWLSKRSERGQTSPEWIIGTALALYFIFDFIFWNGGLVNPSILARMSEIMG